MRTALRSLLLCSAICALAAGSSLADPATSAPEQAIIASGAFHGSTGVLSINQTSGNGNAQANVTVIGGSGKGALPVRQSVAGVATESGAAAIDAFAFSGSSGILQINQSAGSGNAQGNAVLVHVGDAVLSNDVPQQSTGNTQPSQEPNTVSVSKTAFSGAKGIVQISQVAGSGNRTASTFVLQIQNTAGH